jgi:HEAT repeat protein
MLKRWSIAAALVTLALLVSASHAQQGDYLGKSLAAWANDLASNDPSVRRGAVFALGKMGSSADDHLAQVLKILREDKEKSVREAAAFAAGEIGKGSDRAAGQADLVPTLAKALTGDQDALVRRSAAVALGNLGNKAAAGQAALEKALDDPKVEVVQNAAWALGKVAGPAAVPALRKALQHADPYVLRDAANSVGLAGKDGRPALPELLKVCQNPDPEVRKAALGALVGMVRPEDKAAYEPLRGALADRDPEARYNAALALGNIGGDGAKPAVPVLIEAMKQKADAKLRTQAAAVLKNIGPAAAGALDALRNSLRDPDPELRRNVIVAMAGLEKAGVPAFPDLIKVLANSTEEPNVRAEAAVALSKIAAPFLKEGNPPGRENIPALINIIKDTNTPSKVRERTLWILANYQRELPDRKDVFDVLVPIVSSPRTENNKMLRYHTAFMLGAFWRERAPDKALDVLEEFLKDNTIKLFKGTDVESGGASGVEKTGGEAKVKEVGVGDGRVMAVIALKLMGKERVQPRRVIMQQLQTLRKSPDPRLRDEIADLEKRFAEQ